MQVEFEVVLQDKTKYLGVMFVFKRGVADGECDVREGARIEGCVGGFAWVWDEVVVVEVLDEVVEVVLCVKFEGGDVGC